MSTVRYATVLDVTATDSTPLSRSASGYGRKLPTRFTVRVAEDPSRERKVWAICYSNAASFYVVVRGQDLFIRESDLESGLEPQTTRRNQK
jgi:hypothetical protein